MNKLSSPIHGARRTAGIAFLIVIMIVAVFFNEASQRTAAQVTSQTLAANSVPVQFFYVPFPENQLLQGLQAIESGSAGANPISPVTTYISLAAIAHNTIIYYDQWENGYEADIASPANLYSAGNPGGTQIWGDGNPANGAPPGIPSDIVNAGTVIILNNAVNTATQQSVIDFDGRDKVAATKNIAMTRTGWAAGSNTLLAGSIEVYDTKSWGTDYRVPVGENIADSVDFQMFEYTGLAIMAGEGGANVQIDANRDGTFETTVALAEGESHLVNGKVNVGGRVVSDRPVQVDILTGDRASSFESRDSALLPTNLWSNSYYTPVATASYLTTVWLYNPGASSISVSYQRRASGNLTTSTLSVPAGATAKQVLPAGGTGARFYTSGAPFYAFSTTDSTSASQYNQAWDWGFTLVPQSSLTPQVLVGLGLGRDPTSGTLPNENGNPVWVTPIGNGNTAVPVYVDFDADPLTGANTDPNGNRYDTSYSLRELDQARIYDAGDRNQTGMLVYVLAADVKLAAAWGQDPTKATAGAPGLDVGTGVPPCPLFSAGKNGTLETDNDGDGFVSPGDVLLYTIVIHNIGRVPVPAVLLQDNPPADSTYVPNSTYNGATQVPDNAAPATAFPLDEGGAIIGTLPVGGSFTVTFKVTIDSFADLTPGTTELLNTGSATAVGTTIPFSDVTPLYGRIGDRVWNDFDADGIQDAGETGIAGVTVHLLNGLGVVIGTTTTDGNGFYLFTGLLPGDYGVKFVPPAGYNPSPQNQGADDALDSDADPTTGLTATVTLAAGEPNTTLDAGYWQPGPRIDIQKTPDTQTVLPGQMATFDIVVTNTGNVPLTNVTVTDPLAPNCAKAIGSLAAGASHTYACSLANVTAGFTNVATVTGSYGGTTVTDQDDAVVLVDILPDISVTKTAQNAPASVPETGGSVQFTYTVVNHSLEPATITVLADDKFGALGGDGDCQVGTVLAANGGTCSFTATFAIPAGDYPGSHTNTFTATATDDDGNSDTATDDEIVTYTDVLPDISVTKTAQNAPVSVPETGGSVQFTYTVVNHSLEPATITVLADDKFGALTGDGDCQVGTVLAANGGACSFAATFAIPAGDYPGSHTNIFTATATDDDGNSDTATDDEVVTYTDVLPDIAITKTAVPISVPETGGNVQFTIVVTNNSLEAATIDSLVDSDFNLAALCPGGVGTVLAYHQTYTCVFSVIVAGDYESGVPHVNTATVVASDDDGNTDTASDDATVTFTDMTPEIDIEKYVSVDCGATWQDTDTATGPYLVAGTHPQFKFVVTNTGTVALSGLSLSDTDFTAFYASDLKTTCAIPATLAPAASFTCYVGSAWNAGQHANTATASGSFVDGAGNTESDSDTDAAHYFGANPSFTVTKVCKAGTEPIPQEGPALFTVTFQNDGNVPLSISADDGIGTFSLAVGETKTFAAAIYGPFCGRATAENTVHATSTYRDDAGHSKLVGHNAGAACRIASRVNVLKLTQDRVDPSKAWTFNVWQGAHGFGGTLLASSHSLGDADGVLDFGNLNLQSDGAYTLCELAVPAGWKPLWQVDTNHNGFVDTALTPYNPNATDLPPQDLGNRCVDFGAGTRLDLLGAGSTLRFQVNNTYANKGGEPRTPGYWKNWNRCTGGGQAENADRNGGWQAGFWLLEDVLDPNIGGGITWDDILADDFVFPITNCAVAVDILDHREIADPAVPFDGPTHSNDAAYKLATHLLAAQLNFGAGARTCDGATDAALEGERLLDKYNFNGTGDYLLGSDKLVKADYDLAIQLATTLDEYNNGRLCTGPRVSWVSPQDGDTITGDVTLRVDVADAAAVTRVEFFVDGISIGTDTTAADGWSILWPSASVADGSHLLAAVATNAMNQTGSADVDITVENVSEPPPPASISVASLNATATWINPANWRAAVVVTVNPALSGAVVTGVWSNGAIHTCTTSSSGMCGVTLSRISKKTPAVTFQVTAIALAGYQFVPGGTNIVTVNRP